MTYRKTTTASCRKDKIFHLDNNSIYLKKKRGTQMNYFQIITFFNELNSILLNCLLLKNTFNRFEVIPIMNENVSLKLKNFEF